MRYSEGVSQKIVSRSLTLASLIIILLIVSGCTKYTAFDKTSARTAPEFSTPAIPEMEEAEQKMEIVFIHNDDGIKIPVRVFGEENPGTPVLMTHGLQSHSGWFVQSAAYIASLGMPVYQIDRRGSGLSEEPRGHADSYLEMVSDILTVAEFAKRRHGTPKVHLLGHCFGAIPSTAFASQYPDILQSLILSTPAIYTKTGVYFGEKIQILKSELTKNYKYIPIHIKPEQFTENPQYLKYIKEDSLTLKEVTTSLYFQVALARRDIKKNRQNLSMPVFIGIAAEDTICDNSANVNFFNSIPTQRKTQISYRNAKHIIEFSDDKETFFNDLKAWFSATNQLSYSN